MTRAILAMALLLLAACGGGGGDGGGTSAGASAPAFTSASSVSVAERATGAFYAATASGGGAPVFALAGGADQARFAITAAGALSFVNAPDFEAPADANADNVYLVTLQVSNGAGMAMLALSVTVSDQPGVLALRRVASGFSQPVFFTGVGDGVRAFVVEKTGRLRLLNLATGTIAATEFLDISAGVNTTGERGLLGFALAPDFATSRQFYVYFVNTATDIEVRRYRTLVADPDRADTASADTILRFAHPSSNHCGGWIGFGPDGFLYLAVGDGSVLSGANAPNVNTLLGKILRIDPRTDSFPADANRDYAIPAGNPFAGGGGSPEIFARGLRNPFRAGFDRQTGNLYIGDVGENAREEIDVIRSGTDVGLNFGWPTLEGTATFAGGSTAGLTPPVAEYTHGAGALQGNSVTGGYVYRGPIVQFRGQYVFGDFINRRIWTIPVANLVRGATVQTTGFTDRTTAFAPDVGAIGNIPSFGEDDAGNLYIVDFDGEIFVLREMD
jgi:hypothetical protein